MFFFVSIYFLINNFSLCSYGLLSEETSNYSNTSQNSLNLSNYQKELELARAKARTEAIRRRVEFSIKPDVRPTVTPREKPKSSNLKTNYGIYVLCLIPVIILYIVYAARFNAETTNLKSMKEINPFETLKKNFPSQSNNFWRSLEIVLDNALNESNPRPNIVLFISNENVFPNLFFNGIVEITKSWLGNVNPVELTRTDFTTEEIEEDYGAVITYYKPKLIKNRFMVVRDLNYIPANAAQAFHSFCDVYNPAVKRAIIFFTMKVNNKFIAAENATKIAENLLQSVWSVLELNALQPLIGRVTDDVLVIK